MFKHQASWVQAPASAPPVCSAPAGLGRRLGVVLLQVSGLLAAWERLLRLDSIQHTAEMTMPACIKSEKLTFSLALVCLLAIETRISTTSPFLRMFRLLIKSRIGRPSSPVFLQAECQAAVNHIGRVYQVVGSTISPATIEMLVTLPTAALMSPGGSAAPCRPALRLPSGLPGQHSAIGCPACHQYTFGHRWGAVAIGAG